MGYAAGYFIGTIIRFIIIAYILQKVNELFIEKPDKGSFVQTSAGIKANTISTQTPVRIVYGTQRVGGNDVYMYTTGSENKYLYIVQTLAEGECDSIEQRSGVDQVWLGDKLYDEYGGNVSYWFHSGTSAQTVDSHIPDPLWTDTLRNTCYIVFKLYYDKDYFLSIPTRQIEFNGAKIYDFRDTTTAFSRNPVLCLYDYFTNTRYGIGIDSGEIDVTSWTAAANYCDTQGWNLDLVIFENQNAWAIVETILSHFRGILNWWDGKFYLRYQDLYDETSVLTIEDKHIYQDDSGKASISIAQPGRFNRPSGVRVKYIDKDKLYVTDDVLIGESAGVINEFKLVGCTDRQMATDLAVTALERAQLDRVIGGVFRDDCVELEPNDIITFNSTALGISDQLMRVTSSKITDTGLVNLGLQYESYDLYDDDYNIDIEGEYTCSLPDPSLKPPDVSNASITERTYYERLRTYSILQISFDEPTDYAWYKDVEVWQSITGSGYVHQFNTTTDFEVGPVEQGTTYYIKLVTRNIWGVKQDINSATLLSHTVVGKSDEPTSLTSLSIIANDNAINLYADKLNDPDIEVYEFRLGSQWVGGIFLAAIRSPNYSITGVKPGTFTFFCNTKGTNDIYGSTPRSASTTLTVPKGWTAYDTTTYTDDYTSTSSGTHDNTEHCTYNSDDYLKCSHSGSNLTGTYTSKVFDLGAGNNDVYYTYIDAALVTTGVGTTWDDMTASGTLTWDEMNATTTSWNELAEINEAPQVNITLKYKVNSGDTWSEVDRMELCSVVAEFRYFQVIITITDPSLAINALVENYVVKLYN